MSKTVRIGGASAFMTDSVISTPQLLASGKVDYLVYDFLAEFTMSFLARARSADPHGGFHPDFVNVIMRQNLAHIMAANVRVVTNAGGMNPAGCRDALLAVASELGLSVKVAIVDGDDLMPRIDEIAARGISEAYSGAAWPSQDVMSANAYLGAFPIARALAMGADIVLTGRVADSALALGPLIHEFAWTEADLDKLAQGSLLGHVLECGCQTTGGLHTDWRDVPDWDNIGYPIAEARPDGSFTVTKPDGTGGLVSCATVAEQILYEVGDPQAYMLPDVVCDFSEVKLEQIGTNLVRVSGAKGYPPTGQYKVSLTYPEGFRTFALIPIVGRDAEVKGQRTADAIIKRTRKLLRERNWPDYRGFEVEQLGSEAHYGPERASHGVREVVTRIVVDHDDAEALKMFGREANSPVSSMAPGTTGLMGGIQPIIPIVRLFSFMIPRTDTVPVVHLDGRREEVLPTYTEVFSPEMITRPVPPPTPADAGPLSPVPLYDLAFTRSGDKGNKANIGVIARHRDYLPWIRAGLSPERIGAHFRHLFDDPDNPRVDLFDLPGFDALNLLLHDALNGGGTSSRRIDLCAKSLAQQLLDIDVDVPVAIYPLAKVRHSEPA